MRYSNLSEFDIDNDAKVLVAICRLNCFIKAKQHNEATLEKVMEITSLNEDEARNSLKNIATLAATGDYPAYLTPDGLEAALTIDERLWKEKKNLEYQEWMEKQSQEDKAWRKQQEEEQRKWQEEVVSKKLRHRYWISIFATSLGVLLGNLDRIINAF